MSPGQGNSTRNPRSPRPYAVGIHPGAPQEVLRMNPPDEGTPAPTTPDLSAVVEEQKAVIAAMNDKIKALEAKAASNEAKITALSQPAPKAAETPAPLTKEEQAKKVLDDAYEKLLVELGIKKE